LYIQTSSFRFKNYTFFYHPSSFTITRQRVLREFLLPVNSSVIQDLGKTAMKITGTGYLFGEDCMEQFEKIHDLFLEEGSGALFLPGISPVFCYFEELSVEGNPGPRMLRYRFSFLEDTQRNSGKLAARRSYYVVLAGDTLTVIAAKCRMTVEELLSKNPGLSQDNLKEGDILWIS
jgi:hypothetical protein